MPNAPIHPLQTPLTGLRGVGGERGAQLTRLGLITVNDLLLHRPRRYEDRRHFKTIAEVAMNESTTVFGKIIACGLKRWRGGTKSVFEIVIDDGTGHLHCRWWNLPFMQNYFHTGDEVLAFGKVNSLKPRTIDHPETEVLEAGEEITIHLNRIAPIYPLTEGLPQRWLRSFVWRTVQEFEKHIADPHPEISFEQRPTRANAVHMVHFPNEILDTELARQRLALDEFVELQLAMQRRRKKLEANSKGLPCSGNNLLIKKFLAELGFKLTGAQTKVLREIRHDLGGDFPMRRLLQGDVGSGKTVVAACAALMTLESEFNVVLMAPTEILAEQHYRNFQKWLLPLGVDVYLQTGSHKSDERAKNLSLVTRHSSLTVGTHALLEKTFSPEKLGLVIIDEQHKFGVTQRETLLKKGNYPHLLVMTATPIPRTLGLTLYGDLDISVIDESPVGRGEIRTFVRTQDKLPKVWKFVQEQLAAGRQAYMVYPRVDDDGAGDVKAVTKELGKLQQQFGAENVALLHGRLKSAEKDQVMKSFASGKAKILLATSIIEVGVDVANATVMVIENAEQFGLAQLHQLRGRIGRGTHDSYCILIAQAKTSEAVQRLKILEETDDGFRIAEEDLKIRGPGELLGAKQSGLPPLQFGDLVEDVRLIDLARKTVKEKLVK